MFFKKVVDELYSSFSHKELNNNITPPNKFISNINKIIINMIKSNSYSEQIARSVHQLYRKQYEYYRHPLAWYGAVGKKFYNKYYTGIENINSLLAMQIVDGLSSISKT